MLMYILKHQWKAVRSAWNAYGPTSRFFSILLFLPLMRISFYLCFLLDPLFFPKLRKQKIATPIFVLGHPRSGTTFFHRLLHAHGDYVSVSFWEAMVPSLVARVVLRPFVKRAEKKGRDVIFPEETGHEMRLTSVEEEDFLLCQAFASMHCSFMIPTGFAREGVGSTDFFWDHQSTCDRQARFFRKCLERQMLWTGRSQVIAKMPLSSLRVRSLLKEFPDAKILFLYRAPEETLPSWVSLQRSLRGLQWGEVPRLSQQQIEKYEREMLGFSEACYGYFDSLAKAGEVSEEQGAVIFYDALLDDIEGAMSFFYQFVGMEPSPQLKEAFKSAAEKQRGYARKHKNLENSDCQLSLEDIRQQFGTQDNLEFAAPLSRFSKLQDSLD